MALYHISWLLLLFHGALWAGEPMDFNPDLEAKRQESQDEPLHIPQPTLGQIQAYRVCLANIQLHGHHWCSLSDDIDVRVRVTKSLLKDPSLISVVDGTRPMLLYAAAQNAHKWKNYILFKDILTNDTDEKRRIEALRYAAAVSDTTLVKILTGPNMRVALERDKRRPSVLMIAAQALQRDQSSFCYGNNPAPREIFEILVTKDITAAHRKDVLSYGVEQTNSYLVHRTLYSYGQELDKSDLLQKLRSAPFYPSCGAFWRDICCCGEWTFGCCCCALCECGEDEHQKGSLGARVDIAAAIKKYSPPEQIEML